MKKILFLLLANVSLWAEVSPTLLAKRIDEHILIRDYLSAVDEGKRAITLYPQSEEVIKAYFRALCEQGNELEALKMWEQIPESERDKRAILESLAWGVLNRAKQSTQLEIRANVLMAAAATRDVKALPLIQEALRSSNAPLRSLAIRLAANYGDDPLKKEIERLFLQEKLWYLRLDVIQVLGHFGMKHLQSHLKELLLNPKTTLEERGTIQIALVSMYDTISREELKRLVSSDRAVLRRLACDIVAYLELEDLASELYPLLQDATVDVRIAALNAFTILRVQKSVEYITPLLKDAAFDVAITAAWAVMTFDSKLGEEWLSRWIDSPESEHRRLAAGALVATGSKGVNLALRKMQEIQDNYVKATLAVGLIQQRKHVPKAQKELYRILMHDRKSEWMWDGQYNTLFRHLAPSRMRHRDGIPQFPKVVDQMVRLELLSLLCITEYPQAEEVVRTFLKSQSWGITGAAASLLLEEGNDISIELSYKLLNDPDEKVRLQTAFILAMTGNNEEALPILLEAYPRLDRETKIHILQAIAQVGEPSSIPFLVGELKEPFQVLRVAAASALIRCLYH